MNKRIGNRKTIALVGSGNLSRRVKTAARSVNRRRSKRRWQGAYDKPRQATRCNERACNNTCASAQAIRGGQNENTLAFVNLDVVRACTGPCAIGFGSRGACKLANFFASKSSLIGCPAGIIPIPRGRIPMIDLRPKWMLNAHRIVRCGSAKLEFIAGKVLVMLCGERVF